MRRAIVLACVITIAGSAMALPSHTKGASPRSAEDLLAPAAQRYAQQLLTVHSADGPEPLGAMPATVVPVSDVSVRNHMYPTLDRKHDQLAPTRWRVVTGTGNCCENYLAAVGDGTLMDFGGDFLHVSSDAGRTWSAILPAPLRLSGGEGAVAIAPGGDIVGMGWYLFGLPDQVVPFKYDASEDRWYFTVTKLHQPFYDRPTIGVLPGPFTIAGQKVPYISVLRGGLGLISKTPWFYSLDGLNYVVANSKVTDELTGPPVNEWLDVDPWAALDWLQPHEQAGIAPLGRGRALGILPSIPDAFDEAAPFSILDGETLRWSRFSFPSGFSEPTYGGRFAVDSRGHLHYVHVDREIVYRMSRDGGRNWSTVIEPLPEGLRMSSPYYTSLKVNGRLGIAVVALHTEKPSGDTYTNQDLVYKFVIGGLQPKLEKIYLVGNGDLDTSAGLTSTASERFDFPTVTILPSGRIAVSFGDALHRDPSVAIELGSSR